MIAEFFASAAVPPTHDARAEANACAAAGIPVFPFHGVTDGACDWRQEHLQKDVGNHPCCGRSHVSASTAASLIAEWFDSHPNANYAIAAGNEIGSSGMKLCIFETRIGPDDATTTVEEVLKHANICYSVLAKAETPDGTQFHYVSVPLNQGIEKIMPKNATIKSVQYAIGPGSVHAFGARVHWTYRAFAPLPFAGEAIEACEEAPHPNETKAPTAQINTATLPDVLELASSSPSHACNREYAALAATVEDARNRIATMREAAASYAEHGFKLFRIQEGSKGPSGKAWQNNPVDPNAVGDHGLGIIHALSRTCAIDFDDLENAEGWFAAKGLDIDDLLDGDDAVQIKSGRANRAKLLYRLPAGATPPNTVKIKNTDGSMMVEFRCASDGGSGCQDVLPPTLHPDTAKPYEWAGTGDYQNLPVLPDSLLTLWLGLLDVKGRTEGMVGPQGTTIAEGGRNDSLYKLGGDMARLGLSAEAIEASLMLENTKRCSPPLPNDEVRRIAISASTGSLGAKAAASAELSVAGRAELLHLATQFVAGDITTNPKMEAVDSRLPEVMNAMVAYCNSNARTVQPAFALCTALAACSSVLARDFTGAANAHTNLYCIAIGPTACGKENTLRAVSKIIEAYDPARIAGVPASDSGVLTAMKRHPASVFIIDEIGEVLKSIFDPKEASHKAMIGTTFMELYSKQPARPPSLSV